MMNIPIPDKVNIHLKSRSIYKSIQPRANRRGQIGIVITDECDEVR